MFLHSVETLEESDASAARRASFSHESKHEKQDERQLVSTPTAFEDNAHLIGGTVWELLKEHDLKRMA